MLLVVCIILVITLGDPLQQVIGQDVPYIACPQFFQYLRSNNDGTFVGKIMIPNVAMGETKLNVEFSQRNSFTGNSGKLTLDETKESTHYKIQNNIPINYRVEFPIPSVLPKLTALYVNGRLICSASEYPGNSVTIRMQNTLRTSLQTYYTQVPVPGGTSPVVPGSGPPVFQTPQQPSNNNAGDVCGREGTAAGPMPFIHGGTSLVRGQFPWLAAIFQKKVGSTTFVCGGSLISSRTVLTAAHCIRLAQLTIENMSVQLGRYNLLVSNEADVVERNIESMVVNPEYSDEKIPDADVALLHMATPVSFTNLISPICLWSENDDVNLIVDQTGVVTGWGGDELGNKLSPLPKMAPAQIVSENKCLRSSEVFNGITTSRTLCAGQKDGVGPCMGDSGGGLMIQRNGRWTLRGVVSVGQTDKKRCDLTQYVVYCDVAKHRNWVQQNLLG